MQNTNKTSFTVGGFAYHLTKIYGNVYRDHRNDIWILKENRFYSEAGGIISDPIKSNCSGWISADDVFLRDRESYHEFFQSRYYNSL